MNKWSMLGFGLGLGMIGMGVFFVIRAQNIFSLVVCAVWCGIGIWMVSKYHRSGVSV